MKKLVSLVTSMLETFDEAAAFSENGLDSWNVLDVRALSSVFLSASNFNADNSGWDVASAKETSAKCDTFFQQELV